MKQQRNYGIDLLRCVSMFLVVVLHCLSHGGVMQNVSTLSLNYLSVCLMNVAAFFQ